MTKQFNRIKGKDGEEMAAKWLKDRGYKIIDKNNSTKFGELDIIASKNDILIFVEVKFKQTENFGTPEEMIGKNKLMQVRRTAELYLLNNPDIAKFYDRYQIDAVCIVEDTGRISHYENLTF
ncbi:MAG: YraN family protein [Patescibacteria group bacterium]|mgnify:CR=1 FL=1